MKLMNIKESKEIVKDAIKIQKNKVVSELDDIAEKVHNYSLFSDVIGELVEVYGNNNEQREIMVDVMRTIPSNHFNLAEVKGEMNAVNLVFNGITFSISTSRIKLIEISLEEIKEPSESTQEVYKTYSTYEKLFLEKWDGRLDELDHTSEKMLIKTYFYVKKGRETPFLYTRKLRKDNYEEIKIYFEDIRKRINIYNKERQEFQEKHNQYEKELEKYNNSLTELKDNFMDFIEENLYILEDFKNNSWRVEFVNIPEELMSKVNI